MSYQSDNIINIDEYKKSKTDTSTDNVIYANFDKRTKIEKIADVIIRIAKVIVDILKEILTGIGVVLFTIVAIIVCTFEAVANRLRRIKKH